MSPALRVIHHQVGLQRHLLRRPRDYHRQEVPTQRLAELLSRVVPPLCVALAPAWTHITPVAIPPQERCRFSGQVFPFPFLIRSDHHDVVGSLFVRRLSVHALVGACKAFLELEGSLNNTSDFEIEIAFLLALLVVAPTYALVPENVRHVGVTVVVLPRIDVAKIGEEGIPRLPIWFWFTETVAGSHYIALVAMIVRPLKSLNPAGFYLLCGRHLTCVSNSK